MAWMPRRNSRKEVVSPFCLGRERKEITMSLDWSKTGFDEVWEIVPLRLYEVSVRMATYRIYIGETKSDNTLKWQPFYDVLIDEGFDSDNHRSKLSWQRLVGVPATHDDRSAEHCLRDGVHWLEDFLGIKQIGRG
jgi:hypothetical protein